MTFKKNLTLKLMDTAICRTPAFPQNAKLEECWPELKSMIQDSSKSFFNFISGLEVGDLCTADSKIAYSVWKYFNRARLRATPFGSFAAVSTAPVTLEGDGPTFKSALLLHSFEDWSGKDIITGNIKRVTKSSSWFRTNSTIYVVGNEIRYIIYNDGGFEINMLENNDELKLILSRCRDKLSKKEIYELMDVNFQLSPSAIDKLLIQLVGCQLLLTEQFPNITGTDYFTRLQVTINDSAKKYVIAQRKLIKGGLNEEPLKHLPAYLNFMSGFLPAKDSGHLNTFKSTFLKKFDRKAVPLALALDPETGVGYGDFAQGLQLSELNFALENNKTAKKAASPLFYGPQVQFLLNELLKGGTIYLDKYSVTETSGTFPNTLSVMMHYYHGFPVIESAGGCTANALLGRFTMGIDEVHELAKDIAAVEERANPGVLFFDVAYQAEKNVDNVNRRQTLYQAEFPILTWSCHEEVLCVDDILVAVRNNEVLLWSKKHGRRIIPRIPSAYNYSRSDLAIYRFMCDLQYQGLNWDLDFRIQQLLPGLEHYPRIMYKNLIVSPAMWQTGKALTFPLHEKVTFSLERLGQWLQEKSINFIFRCGSGDQTLCFDPAKELDLIAFIHYRRQNPAEQLYLEEALVDYNEGAVDENNQHLMTQYILNYFHEQKVYPAIDQMRPSDLNDYFTPGTKWLYFEIYCHESRSDQVLTRHIRKIVNAHKYQLEHWFFIRYSEPAPHIRLRLKLKKPLDSATLIDAVQAEFKSLLSSGLVSDIQIKTYFPETERYGKDRMDEVESFFSFDSKNVLRLLLKGGDTIFLYKSALANMEALCKSTFTNENDSIAFVRAMAARFSAEFSLNKEDYKRINAAFRELNKVLNKEAKPLNFNRNYAAAFYRLMQKCGNMQEKENLLADLLHMYINRHFQSGQREHEAILYQYLLKLLASRAFISKDQPALLLTL